MSSSDPQPSAEARAEAERLVSLEMDGKCKHMYGSYHMSDCADCIAEAIDRVAGEREREALERAADMLQAKAQSLYDWMEKLPLHTPGRKEKSLRAGELFTAANAVRALVGSVDRAEARDGE